MTDEEVIALRLMRLEQERKEDRMEMRELSDRIDKLTLSLVGFVLTLAVFGLGIAATLLTAGS